MLSYKESIVVNKELLIRIRNLKNQLIKGMGELKNVIK